MQAEFNLTPEPKPDNPSQELNVLLRYLRGKTDWTPAKTITEIFGYNSRKIRSLVEESQYFIISGPGTPGYKHRLDCTSEEIQTSTEKLISQGKKMIRKGIAQRRAAHQDLHRHGEQVASVVQYS